MEEEFTPYDHFLFAQDNMQLCAGHPIIPASNFEELAINLAEYPEVLMTAEEIVEFFKIQSLRFVACGGNFGEAHGVLRKNRKNGWAYLLDQLTN